MDLLIGILLISACLFLVINFGTKWHVESMRKAKDYDYIMTIGVTLFGKEKTKFDVRGSGTVWFHYPSGQRLGTFEEGTLCDLWEYARNMAENGDPKFELHEGD